MKRIGIILFSFFLLASWSAELWVGARPLLVHHQNHWFFPFLESMHPGTDFGQTHDWETDYSALRNTWQESDGGTLVMPMIPFGPLSIDLSQSPPAAPSARHWLGTDSSGRDVTARFIYGFRTALIMAASYLCLTLSLAVLVALLCALGPGWLDLILQRVVEIWYLVPLLYVAIAITSLVPVNKILLILILSFFSWPTLSLYLRALILQVKEEDYIAAARILGLSAPRMIWGHILPQIWPFILTLLPFSFTASLVTLTSLDFLGFGLPPPEPSWGDLLSQAMGTPSAFWMAAPVLVGLFVVLTAVTGIGEAIRNKQNPRQTQNYR